MKEPLTLALPKGRLFKQVQKHFARKGIYFEFEDRKLVARDSQNLFRIFLVKNSDLPTYVHHGIAGLGICGDDVLYESGHPFTRLLTYSFGGTRICLAGHKDQPENPAGKEMVIATKFTKFTRDHYHRAGQPVKIIKLNGSVELAPILGLAPYIVDLVETGNTLKANNLKVFSTLASTQVRLVANPAYYKSRYEDINPLLEIINEAAE